jgi:tetratricopeptide (TPR) repeat protein
MAFTAIDHVEQVRVVAPDFADLKLADGIYHYWRTVLTKRSKLLPDFGDVREQGIDEIESVESAGIFLGPPATLGMLFTWIEERDFDRALASGQKNKKRYPNNLINELMIGIVYLYKKDYDQALATFQHVLEIDPKSKRVRYYRGLTYLRKGDVEQAEAEFTAYLGFDYMEDYQRASAHYRLGQLQYRTKRYAEAEASYKQAIKLNGSASAKAALESMRKARRVGTISW